ncbi:MAG TPA: ParB/RepB/Spo0J family partition protein [Candidatus Saccharicenans sp.]|mgnify:CR=1 FL=1|nr:ParB/RepB/Spo0J family partition protein [Candidatus Saccharicenans sp.]
MELRSISLEEINFDDIRFRFTLDKPDEKLIFSIQRAGLIEPVLVKSEGQAFILVTGWRRVEASRQAGLKEIPALVIPSESTDLDLFSLAFFESYPGKDFSLAEKALIIKKFIEFGLSPEELIEEFLSRLELPPERQTIDLLTQLASLDWALPSIHRGRWKLSTARLFLSFFPEERRAIISVGETLNHNQQAELIELLFTLKKRQKVGLETILAEEEIKPLVQEAARERQPRARLELLSALRKRTFPLVTEINREMQTALRQINLSGNSRLDYDHSLEKSSLFISFEARTTEEIELLAEQLKQNVKEGKLDVLFGLLNKKIDK